MYIYRCIFTLYLKYILDVEYRDYINFLRHHHINWKNRVFERFGIDSLFLYHLFFFLWFNSPFSQIFWIAWGFVYNTAKNSMWSPASPNTEGIKQRLTLLRASTLFQLALNLIVLSIYFSFKSHILNPSATGSLLLLHIFLF